MEKEDDSKAQVLFLDSSMNMKHNNCAVNINKSQRKIDFQVTGKSRCLCKHIKYKVALIIIILLKTNKYRDPF